MRLDFGKIGSSLLIALLTMAGTVYVVLRFSGGYRQFTALAEHISLRHWLLLSALSVLFYLLDYARYRTLFAVCGETLSLGLSLQLTCVSYFVSTLAPGSELYIPAVIFLASRRGISVSRAAAVAMIKPFYLTIWVCLIGLTSLGLRHDVHLPPFMSSHMTTFLLPFWLLCFVLAYVIFFPDRFKTWADAKLSENDRSWWQKKALSSLLRCAEAISTIGRSTSLAHLAAHLSSILFVLVYVAIGAVLTHAMGMSLSFGKALTVFSNSLMVCYLSPSPAGMGITEMATAYLLDPSMTHSVVVIGTMLRFLCWYIVVIPGAFILAYTVNSKSKMRSR